MQLDVPLHSGPSDPNPVADASVWRMNFLVQSGVIKTGLLLSASFSKLNECSHASFHLTTFSLFFLVSSVNEFATV